MKWSKQEQLARIEQFASLWERLFNLYLNEEQFEDISPASEDEFLSLQGSIMQNLAAIAEFEEGRFALVDEVSSVINEAVSLHQLKTQSDFQVRRRKERGRQVEELIGKVRRFVAERDAQAKRQEKELEVRLSRPFWDPEKGRFGTILARVVTSPARFFSAIRVAGEAKKANTFLLALLSLLMIGCVATLVAFNARTARAIAYNTTLESGILTSDQGLGAKVLIWAVVVFGVVLVSLAAAIVGAVLAHLLTLLMHVGFKLVGAKSDMVASHKVVAFGLTPLLLLVLLPFLGYLVRQGVLSPVVLAVLGVAVLLYVAVLHVIGAAKVHTTSVPAGILGWLVGIILFGVVALAGLWLWHHSEGQLPPSSGNYVYVTAKRARMFKENKVVRTFSEGNVLTFLGEEKDSYNVKSEKDEGTIKKSDARLQQGSVWSLPVFLVESSVARAEALIDRLSREIKKEAGGSS